MIIAKLIRYNEGDLVMRCFHCELDLNEGDTICIYSDNMYLSHHYDCKHPTEADQ